VLSEALNSTNSLGDLLHHQKLARSMTQLRYIKTYCVEIRAHIYGKNVV